MVSPKFHAIASLLLCISTIGCGDDGSSGTADAAATTDAASAGGVDAAAADAVPGDAEGAPIDASTTQFTLTSTRIVEGGAIPVQFSCQNAQGEEVSPPLAWVNPPAGTAAFAVVFTDLDNSLTHSVIWDIPGTRRDLPEGIAHDYQPTNVPGAKQPTGYDRQTRGYLGPCPRSEHTYQLALHAIDVATLPSVGMRSGRAAVIAALAGHILATATLTATFDPNNP